MATPQRTQGNNVAAAFPPGHDGDSVPAAQGDADDSDSESSAAEDSCASSGSVGNGEEQILADEGGPMMYGSCCFASADVLLCPGLVRTVDGYELYVPTDSMLASPLAMRPAFKSMRSCQRRARPLCVATLMTGHSAKP